MEIIINLPENRPKLKAVLFDFDGTISTLRYGWEDIMEPMMLEMIAGTTQVDDELIDKVKKYIDQSTGIQTIYQMEWLAKTVKEHGANHDLPDDPWWYKAEYNKRLMLKVDERKNNLFKDNKSQDDYLIKGSKKLLQELSQNSIDIYVASGTDDPDVKEEAKALGVSQYFKEICGAPLGRADCSKEAVLERLINDNKLQSAEVAVIGDGKVEIALGRKVGAITLGLASNEETRQGVNPVKRARLIKAGAHAITGDFLELDELLTWLNV